MFRYFIYKKMEMNETCCKASLILVYLPLLLTTGLSLVRRQPYYKIIEN